ncbi:beta-lactamase domain-containing protein [Clostridium sp. CAG:354]|nr:MBL fold metallo-hydrolase [Clostridium sp.]MBS5864437.1 MBL fold metallo-hydrolase [Clostridium sp.]CDE11407.1 beta-lactamase domain-containing protein [Clostridium sp. CAG:354]
MILKRIKVQMKFVGETNCYIIVDETQKKAMVIDPAGEVPKIIEILNTLGAELVYIYLTHCHADHINGVNELKKEKGGKVLIHRKGRENLENRVPVLAEYIGLPPIYVKEDSIVDDDDILHVGDLELRVIYTPGHTDDGTSLYCEKEEMLFSGDTLFKGAWGRVDLPTSDFDSIMNSIIKKLLILPENTIVYPGHGKPTRIGDEKPIYLEAKPNID